MSFNKKRLLCIHYIVYATVIVMKVFTKIYTRISQKQMPSALLIPTPYVQHWVRLIIPESRPPGSPSEDCSAAEYWRIWK